MGRSLGDWSYNLWNPRGCQVLCLLQFRVMNGCCWMCRDCRMCLWFQTVKITYNCKSRRRWWWIYFALQWTFNLSRLKCQLCFRVSSLFSEFFASSKSSPSALSSPSSFCVFFYVFLLILVVFCSYVPFTVLVCSAIFLYIFLWFLFSLHLSCVLLLSCCLYYTLVIELASIMDCFCYLHICNRNTVDWLQCAIHL